VSPAEEPGLQQLAHDSVPWVTIGSAAVAVCSFLILLGMWVGPQKDVPEQLDKLMTRIDSVDGRLSKIEWANESQKTQIGLLGNQMAVESSERNKIADALRDVKSAVDGINANYLKREIFIEWKAEFEARTRDLNPLMKGR
jgi:hypothetical protein